MATLKGGQCSHDDIHQTSFWHRAPSAERPPLDPCRPSSLIWHPPPPPHTQELGVCWGGGRRGVAGLDRTRRAGGCNDHTCCGLCRVSAASQCDLLNAHTIAVLWSIFFPCGAAHGQPASDGYFSSATAQGRLALYCRLPGGIGTGATRDRAAGWCARVRDSDRRCRWLNPP